MAQTPSQMIALGTEAPDFALPDTTGAIITRDGFIGSPLLVGFICNHCPFVKHIGSQLGILTKQWLTAGVAVVLINPNDWTTHPDDAPEHMPAFLSEYGIPGPYLVDESQDVARAYGAACTPDFFLYDRDHKLVYRGQFDSARPGNDIPVTGEDLDAAVQAVLAGKDQQSSQNPSIGCGIKWRQDGNGDLQQFSLNRE